jgi:crotonobetaine/carnitine-CoA ligase
MSVPHPHTVVGGRSLPAILRDGAARHPDRELLVFEDGAGDVSTYSWRLLHERSLAVAAHLAGLGVRPGDRVHLHLPNRPEFLLTWFAAAQLGAAIVPTNVAATAPELAYILEHAGPRVSVTDTAGARTVRAARELAGVPGAVVVCEQVDLLGLPAAADRTWPLPAPEDELAVMYTSGTTSRPKGVRITHANYVFAGEVVAAALRLTPEDRFLTVLPLFHANAQYYSTMGTLVSGGTLLLASRFSASRILEQAVRLRATVASLFAAPMRMILAQEPVPLWREHALRVVVFAQRLTHDELARWDALVGAPLLQLYGMTETIGPPLMNPLHGERRHDTIGRPVLGYTCRVVREDGSPTDVGEQGELLIGGIPGVSLMQGYLHDPQATASVLADGWLRTGDVVSVDGDGYVTFIDRTKDMIKRAGENVAASEVEAVLLEHPRVLEAAVFGVPDDVRDERVIAYVVTRSGRGADGDELIAWCAERLARFRVPEHIELVSELPRTAVGKVVKHALRADFLDRHTGPSPLKATTQEERT